MSLEDVIGKLSTRIHAATKGLPSPRLAERLLRRTIHLLFPQRSIDEFPVAADPVALGRELDVIHKDLVEILTPLQDRIPLPASQMGQQFIARLPELHDMMRGDAEALYRGDPAAKSIEEVLLTYPGFFATAVHRLAHELHRSGVPLVPRIFSEYAHHYTGIDIHPGATIGAAFCIDHGTGIVIGETATLGNNVKLYQGVTLGALSVDKSLSQTKRHPTLEDDVVVYSNATILGGSTIVGKGSTIGGNVWLTESVPPYSTVYHRGDVSMRAAPQSK